jgi:hypothetical protein
MDVMTNSAFPVSPSVCLGQEGLTIRAYFAARAPRRIPKWFEPTMREKPPAPPVRVNLTGIPLFEGPDDDIDALSRRNSIQNALDGWRRDPCWDLASMTRYQPELYEAAKERVEAYEHDWQTYWNGLVDWQRERQRERVAQWPWAFADLVLAAGGFK